MMRSFTTLRPWQQHLLMAALVISTFLMISALQSHAGAGGTEFKDAYDKLKGWLDGYLGKAIALAFFVVGLFMGIVRQSIMAACVSLGAAFAIILLPSILNSMMSATITAQSVLPVLTVGVPM